MRLPILALPLALASCGPRHDDYTPPAKADLVTSADALDTALIEAARNGIEAKGGAVLSIQARDGVACGIFQRADRRMAFRMTAAGDWIERDAAGESTPSRSDCSPTAPG